MVGDGAVGPSAHVQQQKTSWTYKYTGREGTLRNSFLYSNYNPSCSRVYRGRGIDTRTETEIQRQIIYREREREPGRERVAMEHVLTPCDASARTERPGSRFAERRAH